VQKGEHGRRESMSTGRAGLALQPTQCGTRSGPDRVGAEQLGQRRARARPDDLQEAESR
jgi:hypothetical protein